MTLRHHGIPKLTGGQGVQVQRKGSGMSTPKIIADSPESRPLALLSEAYRIVDQDPDLRSLLPWGRLAVDNIDAAIRNLQRAGVEREKRGRS